MLSCSPIIISLETCWADLIAHKITGQKKTKEENVRKKVYFLLGATFISFCIYYLSSNKLKSLVMLRQHTVWISFPNVFRQQTNGINSREAKLIWHLVIHHVASRSREIMYLVVSFHLSVRLSVHLSICLSHLHLILGSLYRRSRPNLYGITFYRISHFWLAMIFSHLG